MPSGEDTGGPDRATDFIDQLCLDLPDGQRIGAAARARRSCPRSPAPRPNPFDLRNFVLRQVVLADGEVVEASATSHSDPFRVLKRGGTFGIGHGHEFSAMNCS
jgi:hypothetical protein